MKMLSSFSPSQPGLLSDGRSAVEACTQAAHILAKESYSLLSAPQLLSVHPAQLSSVSMSPTCFTESQIALFCLSSSVPLSYLFQIFSIDDLTRSNPNHCHWTKEAPVCAVPSLAFWLGAKLITATLSWVFVCVLPTSSAYFCSHSPPTPSLPPPNAPHYSHLYPILL